MNFEIEISDYAPTTTTGDIKALVMVNIKRVCVLRGITVIEQQGKSPSVAWPTHYSLLNGFPCTFPYVLWEDKDLETAIMELVLAEHKKRTAKATTMPLNHETQWKH